MSINNKRSYTEYTITQPTTDFAIGFDDFDEGSKANILVTLNGVLVESLGYAAIRKNESTVSITPAITEGTVRLTRETDIDESFHKFTAGALFSAKSMDESFQQVRHSQQEVRDGFEYLAFNTDGIVQAAKDATTRANEAADAVEGLIIGKVRAQDVTTTANGVGSVPRTLRDKLSESISVKDFGAVGNGLTEDTIAVQKAIDYVASKGGGVVYFPAGDYPIKVNVTTPNIKFQGENINSTTIRAANTTSMIRVHTTAAYFKLDNIKLTGQTIEQEASVTKRFNTRALHCIHLNGYKPTLTNFSTRGGRYDGVYIDYEGEIDATFTDFFMDTSARNSLSVISGSKLTFERGHIYIDNTCHSNEGEVGSLDLAGTYIVDFEPDYIGHKYDNIIFDNVLFENNGTSPDNWQIKFENNNIGDVNDLRLTMRDCEFRAGANTTTAPSICPRSGSTKRVFKNILVENLKTAGRVATISNETVEVIEDSTFKDITFTNIAAFGYGVFLGKNCVAENWSHTKGTAISIQRNSGVRLKNVSGNVDTALTVITGDVSSEVKRVDAIRYVKLTNTKAMQIRIPQNSCGTLKVRAVRHIPNAQQKVMVDVHFITRNSSIEFEIVDLLALVTMPIVVKGLPSNEGESGVMVLQVSAANIETDSVLNLECFVSSEAKSNIALSFLTKELVTIVPD